ncbi:MAG: tRNA uridine-5-carboxymethylaminomethyl(34) synthesis enzyme MnmG [Firmicutes bacterium]|nr:tRNA uridine-5-carboxymethylaminomethyl(34) synthesis enzyme MnmG [Bacillota bacterium]
MTEFMFDSIVVGAGHAGVEAALALSKLNKKTLVLTISLDNVSFLACNPSIGGTAKGHLVKEIDALGGIMGQAADKTLIQLRMLNMSKGFAVQSLRAQVDKNKYHQYIKSAIENDKNIQLREGEVLNIEMTDNNEFRYKISTDQLNYYSKTIIFACGVYLSSKIFIGNTIKEKGPASFARANHLSDSLKKLGIPLRRFKTGTPARVKKDTINLNILELQSGEQLNYTFSSLTKKTDYNKLPCYLGYTNQNTHDIIKNNLNKTAKSIGNTEGEGARYCPSIEDKIERFNKDRHPFFLEPEGVNTQEMYVQGISTSLPSEIQLKVYRSLDGFENVQIMRDAYAIEYDCIDPRILNSYLMHKEYEGMFFAGQINGTSGYEEAAAQGLIAGTNAALYLDKKPPLILRRDNSYIGVMIDDLVTKGADEPYRMMTSRAEYRLHLRQDNADLRLSKIAKDIGLLTNTQYNLFKKKQRDIEKIKSLLKKRIELEEIAKFIKDAEAMPLEKVIRHHQMNFEDVLNLNLMKGITKDSVLDMYICLRYQGYLERENRIRHEQARLENIGLPLDFDYTNIHGLRLEAAEKLNKIKPHSIAQASRIAGVNPADINVLLVRLKNQN